MLSFGPDPLILKSFIELDLGDNSRRIQVQVPHKIPGFPTGFLLGWFSPPQNLSKKGTLPETNSSPLKIGHPKRKLVFQPPIFRCDVSFRECNDNVCFRICKERCDSDDLHDGWIFFGHEILLLPQWADDPWPDPIAEIQISKAWRTSTGLEPSRMLRLVLVIQGASWNAGFYWPITFFFGGSWLCGQQHPLDIFFW